MSEAEMNALKFLNEHGGSVLVTAIEDKNSKDMFGNIVPGMKVFKKLEKQGLLHYIEEEPCESLDGFTFTDSIELTEEGTAAAKKLR